MIKKDDSVKLKLIKKLKNLMKLINFLVFPIYCDFPLTFFKFKILNIKFTTNKLFTKYFLCLFTNNS